MKRDMDLIRTILLKVEENPKFVGPLQSATAAGFGIEDHNEMEFAYNCAQLVEAEFLTGNTRMADRGQVVVGKLTWKGHEFVDAVRDPEVWAKTKKGAAAAGGFTFDLLKDLAKGFLKTQIEERTGIKL